MLTFSACPTVYPQRFNGFLPRADVRFGGCLENGKWEERRQKCRNLSKKALLGIIGGSILTLLGGIAGSTVGAIHRICNTPPDGAVAQIKRTGIHLCPDAYLYEDGKVSTSYPHIPLGRIDSNGTAYNFLNFTKGQAREGAVYNSILGSNKLEWPVPSAYTNEKGLVKRPWLLTNVTFANIKRLLPLPKEKAEAEVRQNQESALALYSLDKIDDGSSSKKSKKKGS